MSVAQPRSSDGEQGRGGGQLIKRQQQPRERRRLNLPGRGKVGGNGWHALGGYMNAKRQKLQAQFDVDQPREISKACQSSNIFQGVAIFVNGYTQPSSDELKRLMMLHGGRCEHYFSKSRVTHIVARNLPDSKIKKFLGTKVVNPQWILDCIKAAKLLSDGPYQLYTAKSMFQKGLHKYPLKNDAKAAASIMTLEENQLAQFPNVSKSGGIVSECIETMSESSIGGEKSNSDDSFAAFPEISAIPKKTEEQNSDYMSENTDTVGKKTLSKCSVDHACTSSLDGETNSAKFGEPTFINEFYKHSRLHHLSTWKAEFRAFVSELQTKGDTCFPGREKLRKLVADSNERIADVAPAIQKKPEKPEKILMHVDIDCFFLSVGIRDRPELKDKPVAVTHSKGRGMPRFRPGTDPEFEKREWKLKRQLAHGKNAVQGYNDNAADFDDGDDVMQPEVLARNPEHTDDYTSLAEIACCSYKARETGVKNGMFVGEAKRLCPDLITIPYNFEDYKQVSTVLYETVASYTHDIEAVSCDEMLVDCTGVLSDTGISPLDFARALTLDIYTKTKCTASAGLGANVLLARLATQQAKPNGVLYVEPDKVLEFVSSQLVTSLPGVGWSLGKKLKNLGVSVCGDLQKISSKTLEQHFGPRTAHRLYRACRGQGDESVRVEHQRKSVSAEINYGIRFKKKCEVQNFLQKLAEEVQARLEHINMQGKTVTLKMMIRRQDAPLETSKYMGHGICKNISRSTSLPLATDNAQIIAKECFKMFGLLGEAASDVRGVGIHINRLESTVAADPTRPQALGRQSLLSYVVTEAAAAAKSPQNHPEIFGPSRTLTLTSFGSDNLAAELTRKKFDKSTFPPLPTLPDFSTSPENEEDFSERQPHYDLPSASQIDKDILRELPADMQEQIKIDIQLKKQKQSSLARERAETIPRSISYDADKPGCSFWPDVAGLNHNPKNKIIKNSSRTEIAQAGDVDRNLHDETQGGGHSSLPFLKATLSLKTLKQADTSPRKIRSPRKNQRNSPLFKVPLKKVEGSRKPKFGKHSSPTKSVRKHLFKTQSEMDAAPSHALEQQPQTGRPETSSIKRVSLCGAVELGEVRSLLKEWLTTCTEPDAQDEQFVVTYLNDLIMDKNLEQVYLVLKYLYRNIKNLGNPKWLLSLQNIMECVQNIVSSVYQSKLQLNFTFVS